MRVIFVAAVTALAMASAARADYLVLRSGERLNVTGYQLLGDFYRVQLRGGVADIPASEVLGIEPEEVFIAPPPVETANAPAYGDLIHAAAKRYGVDEDLIVSVIQVESNFDARAISRRNARGLMQLLPQTARRLGVRNIFDPRENIEAGTRYLRNLLALYRNDRVLALAAYNAGPERVQVYGGVPPYTETVQYVRRIEQEYAKRKAAGPSSTPSPSDTL